MCLLRCTTRREVASLQLAQCIRQKAETFPHSTLCWTLYNGRTDANSGRVWPLVLLIVAVSIGWIAKDPDLRRGLGQMTG